MMVRDRQRNGDLAIVLLAELAAILPSPRRPSACLFFGKPVSSMIQASTGAALIRGSDSVNSPNLAENGLVRPTRLAHEIETAIDAAPKPAPEP